MINPEKNRTLILLVLIAAMFGILGGVAGGMIARAYLLDDVLNIPWLGEISVSDNYTRGPSVIIRDAKRVVIEQDTKALETINSAGDIIVGIFEKLPPARQAGLPGPQSGAQMFDPDESYILQGEISEGLILTSDGWAITSFQFPGAKSAVSSGSTGDIAEKYVAISRERRVYTIDKILPDPAGNFSLIHIDADNLPVRRLLGRSEIEQGQTVIAVNWDGQSLIATVVDIHESGNGLISDSDTSATNILLSGNIDNIFYGSFLFNLAGDVAGSIGKQGRVRPISDFLAPLRSALEYGAIRRASLGVYYLDLSDVVLPDKPETFSLPVDQGALIHKNSADIAVVKNSAAMLAGLKEGDIIISVDNLKIDENNGLNSIICGYIADKEIDISFWRGSERLGARIKLQERK